MNASWTSVVRNDNIAAGFSCTIFCKTLTLKGPVCVCAGYAGNLYELPTSTTVVFYLVYGVQIMFIITYKKISENNAICDNGD